MSRQPATLAPQQAPPAAKPAAGILRRRCACGKNTAGTGECGACGRKRASELMRAPADDARRGVDEVPPLVHEVLRSPGRPLDDAARAFFEPRFGMDFSRVRVHADERAAESAKSVGALAYTVGNHIAFGAGRYAAGTAAGLRLLAHELTHVAQHADGVAAKPERAVSDPTGADEREAEAASAAAASGARVRVRASGRPDALLHRVPETWYRGEAVGVGPAPPGGMLHDFGDGLYLTNSQRMAGEYADLRAGDQPTLGRVRAVRLERSLLGRVLDLTQDARWQRYVRTRFPSGQTIEQLIRGANENYSRFFETFLRENNININEFDSIIGPEYVRGQPGETQVCIRNPSIQQQVRAMLRVVPRTPPTPRGGGTPPPESGGTPPPESPATPRTPTQGGGAAADVVQGGVAVAEGAQGGGAAAAQGVQPGGTPAPEAPGGAQAAGGSTQFRVSTQYRVLSSARQSNGSFVSEIEVLLGDGLESLNRAAADSGGQSLPARVVVRVTQSAEGALTAAEAVEGPAALAETLARQALSSLPRAAVTGEAAAAGAAPATGVGGAAAGASPWVRGIGWAGVGLFVVVTGYQYAAATPSERPRVLVQAGGGLAGGALTGYIVCNLIFGLPSGGWSMLGCALVAGAPGAIGGSYLAGEAYEATLTPVERAMRDLERQPENVRGLFYSMTDSAGSSGGLIVTEEFVRGFMRVVPSNLTAQELAALRSSLGGVRRTDTLEGILARLQSAISRLPGRRPLLLPPALDITDIPAIRGRGPVRIDALGGGRIRLGPVTTDPPPAAAPSPREGPTTLPGIEIQL